MFVHLESVSISSQARTPAPRPIPPQPKPVPKPHVPKTPAPKSSGKSSLKQAVQNRVKPEPHRQVKPEPLPDPAPSNQDTEMGDAVSRGSKRDHGFATEAPESQGLKHFAPAKDAGNNLDIYVKELGENFANWLIANHAEEHHGDVVKAHLESLANKLPASQKEHVYRLIGDPAHQVKVLLSYLRVLEHNKLKQDQLEQERLERERKEHEYKERMEREGKDLQDGMDDNTENADSEQMVNEDFEGMEELLM